MRIYVYCNHAWILVLRNGGKRRFIYTVNFDKPVAVFCIITRYPLYNMSLQLLGFGLSVLEGIDPNPENYVSAGILHVRAAQVGILARLEPNKAAQVRFSKICNFSEILCSLPEHKCSENYCHTPVVSFIVVVCVIDTISVGVILRQKLLLNKKLSTFHILIAYCYSN